MARKCKNCEGQTKIENPTVREENAKKVFFFPAEGKKIEANSYEEALQILSQYKE